MTADTKLKRAASPRVLRLAGIGLCLFLLALGLLCIFAVNWYLGIYGDIGFNAIVNTLFGPMDNVEASLINSFILYALVPALVSFILLCFFLFLKARNRLVIHIGKNFCHRIYPFSRPFATATALFLAVCTLTAAAFQAGVPSYVRSLFTKTTFIEDHYIDPNTTTIVFPQEKQNLIMICLESMETSFFSREQGGGNDVNVIPELYELASSNVNFSSNDSVGGFYSLSGSNWTIGALVSFTSGVPLKTDFLNGTQSAFLPGLTTFTDILHQNGYYQAFMVGSDGNFGGRKLYYQSHGTDRVYDLYTAYEDGIVPEDYYVWWGMEDFHLFEYAKQELTQIAAQEQPFAFTMLTVDTHHVGGYVCSLCESTYPEQYENVLACSSKQVAEFVDWIQQQDFAENTTIVICGDHCSMDIEYIEQNISPEYDRKVYNCFINPVPSAGNAKNREFCSLDMFPTILASVGCSIEGDRLGLGTNLFSTTPTLCEELGAAELSTELSNYSDFYLDEFL